MADQTGNSDLKTSSSRSQAQRYYSQGYFWLMTNSLSVKTQFLRRELSTIFTVEYFLEVILSIFRFKRNNFLSENVIFQSKHVYKMATILKEALTLHHANVTQDD